MLHEEIPMKKILLGIAAAFALSTLPAIAFADDKPAEEKKEEKPKKEKKAKKGKAKEEKKEEPKKE
jgi:hypothetical protein